MYIMVSTSNFCVNLLNHQWIQHDAPVTKARRAKEQAGTFVSSLNDVDISQLSNTLDSIDARTLDQVTRVIDDCNSI